MSEIQTPQGKGESETKLQEELLRLAAEFDNYRKAVAKEREFWRERTVDEVVLQILPVYEALAKALAADQDPQNLREGLAAVLAFFQEILTRLDCTPIPTVEQDFDPLYHEAVVAEVSSAPKGKILAEIERGWIRNGRVIRPAKVKVSLGPQGGEAA